MIFDGVEQLLSFGINGQIRVKLQVRAMTRPCAAGGSGGIEALGKRLAALMKLGAVAAFTHRFLNTADLAPAVNPVRQ
jgi:hypothetical protein